VADHTALHVLEKAVLHVVLSGGSCRTRTYNPLIKSQLLCQLS
jgi:hypothetical protein